MAEILQGFLKASGAPVSLVEAPVFPGRTENPAETSASQDNAGADGVSGGKAHRCSQAKTPQE